MIDLLLKDFVDRRALERIQLERLQETLARVYARVPFYQKAFDEKGVKPSDLKCLADLAKFPFTLKKDLRDSYPFGLLACDMKEISRIHASSGTTGKPTVVGYTQNDIDIWAETLCRDLQMGGCTEHDIIQVAYGYGLFTGGLGAHYGVERLGAAVVPAGGGATEKQIMLIKDLGVTAICCTPSFFMHIIEQAAQMGIDLHDTKLRHGFFGAEPWTDEMRQVMIERSGIAPHDIYGLSEIMGPGVSGSCEYNCGLHIFEDHYYPEIIDPDTGEVLPEGVEGELVFTHLTKTGMPLVRYRTRDISALHYEKCQCGRTLVRMERVRRRSDDMLIIRGVNVFPSQVESVLLTVPGIEPHYQLIISREGTLDQMEVRVEVNSTVFSDQIGKMEALRREVNTKIKQIIGINAKITLAEPGTIERFAGKGKRVIDQRKK